MNTNLYSMIFVLTALVITNTYAQENPSESDEFVITQEQLIIVFGGFSVAIIIIFLYLARDIIFRRKTDYDKGRFESQKNKDYEKYHSEWSDDYEDFQSRSNRKYDKEFEEELRDSKLSNYYDILGVKSDATTEEIKKKFRELAKEVHPDKSKEKNSEDKMAQINKAYEVLSDEEQRKRYDRYFKVS